MDKIQEIKYLIERINKNTYTSKDRTRAREICKANGVAIARNGCRNCLSDALVEVYRLFTAGKPATAKGEVIFVYKQPQPLYVDGVGIFDANTAASRIKALRLTRPRLFDMLYTAHELTPDVAEGVVEETTEEVGSVPPTNNEEEVKAEDVDQ